MLKTSLIYSSLLITVLSSFFLVRGSLEMTPKDILHLSSSTWDSSPYAVQSLCKQKADSMIGSILLFVSFFLQLRVLSLPNYCDDKIEFKGKALAVIICIIVYLISLVVSSALNQYYYKQVLDYQKVSNRR